MASPESTPTVTPVTDPTDRAAAIRAEGRSPIDLTRLTLGEVATLEDLSGLPLAQIADADNAPQGKLLAAMVFVSERRRGHSIKWPECLALDIDVAMAMLGLGDDDEPEADTPDTDADPEA